MVVVGDGVIATKVSIRPESLSGSTPMPDEASAEMEPNDSLARIPREASAAMELDPGVGLSAS